MTQNSYVVFLTLDDTTGRSSPIIMWKRDNAGEEAEGKKILHLLFGKGTLSSLAVCVVCSMPQYSSLGFDEGGLGHGQLPHVRVDIAIWLHKGL